MFSSVAFDTQIFSDVEYAFSLSYPTPATFYTTGGSPPFEPDDLEPTDSNEPYSEVGTRLDHSAPFLNDMYPQWLSYMLSIEDPPQTISTSYGDDEQTGNWCNTNPRNPILKLLLLHSVPYSYAKRVCEDFAQLGACCDVSPNRHYNATSLLGARGVSIIFASGDGGVGDGDPDPATQECYSNDGRNVTEFIPGFPASCP